MSGVLLLLALAGLANAFSGQFLQLTDIHLDLKYAVGTDIQRTSCHALQGGSQTFGERWFCDSPEPLIDQLLGYVANTTSPDFILLTGDFSRHDDYPPVPKTPDELFEEETKVALKISRYFPNVPVLPSIGNNDVFPHDVMDPPGPGNRVLRALAVAWAPLLDASMEQSMLQGGWMQRRIVGGNQIVSLNTLYFAYGPDCNVTSSTSFFQLEWLSALLQDAKAAGKFVIISGHIPPFKWLPGCRSLYATLAVGYNATIKSHIYAHLHSDEFHFVSTDGSVDSPSANSSNSFAFTCSPSVVPNFNPSYRVWNYDQTSLSIKDYTQFYADINALNNGTFTFHQEYQLMQAYQVNGDPSTFNFWSRLSAKIQQFPNFQKLYTQYRWVSSGFSGNLKPLCRMRSHYCL